MYSGAARKYRNHQRKQNYASSQKGKRKPFTPEEDEKILKHEITDRELSEIIYHSVESIQIRRSRLLKKQT